jgi:hypothetical protein
MDNNTTTPKPSDDQELANLLANLGDKSASGPAPVAPAGNEPKPAAVATPAPAPSAPIKTNGSMPSEPPKPAAPAPGPAKPDTAKNSDEDDLEAIKNKALDELRPLAERIDLPPADKFDTLLLMIRTTDDKSLIKYAHDIARQIEDKDKQAQALLDIVKEVDFFTHK